MEVEAMVFLARSRHNRYMLVPPSASLIRILSEL
jgi:hypothetical protein